MPDEMDHAQAREDEFRADSIEAWARRANASRVKDSVMHCRVCDERIPAARRRAVPGVQTCIACQAELEFAMRINR